MNTHEDCYSPDCPEHGIAQSLAAASAFYERNPRVDAVD